MFIFITTPAKLINSLKDSLKVFISITCNKTFILKVLRCLKESIYIQMLKKTNLTVLKYVINKNR